MLDLLHVTAVSIQQITRQEPVVIQIFLLCLVVFQPGQIRKKKGFGDQASLESHDGIDYQIF